MQQCLGDWEDFVSKLFWHDIKFLNQLQPDLAELCKLLVVSGQSEAMWLADNSPMITDQMFLRVTCTFRDRSSKYPATSPQSSTGEVALVALMWPLAADTRLAAVSSQYTSKSSGFY